MKHNSIRFTLIIAFHILFMLSSCLTLFLFLRWASIYLEKKSYNDLVLQGRLLRHGIEQELAQNDLSLELIKREWQEIGNPDFHLRVSDVSGALVFDSALKGKPSGIISKESLSAINGTETFWKSSKDENQSAYVSVPLLNIDRTVGVLEISHSFEENNKILSAFIGFLGWSMAGALIIGVIGLFFIISWIMRPVLNLANVADAISAGNLDERAKERSRRDEVGILARSINLMADKLTGQLASLEEERSSMRGLLATLMDGVIALNNKLQVVFLNSSAERALRLSSKNVLMQQLRDVWPNQQVLTWVEENVPKMLPTSTDIKLPHNPLRLFLLPVGEVPGKEERVMLLFRDMTELQRFEEMRSQFMGHVSHELRTPLTIIKGNVVTLLDEPFIGENPTYKKLLQRMEDETERLAKLVEELLDYARLKSGQIPLSMTPVLLHIIVLEVTDSFRDHASRYDVTIETELPGAVSPILGDPGKIRQILLNLLDNALKFSPPGGIIRVAVSKQGEGDSTELLLSVKDSGPGIPPEDLPYIFDRFYQGEQSIGGKAPKVRGLGLGLAIVKELAELHGAAVSADSSQGNGTTLTVIFSCLPYNQLKNN